MLKADQRTSHIPVILLTAQISEEKQLKGLKTGADEFLMKPFNIKILHQKIKNLLAIRQNLREEFTRKYLLTPEKISTSSGDNIFIRRAIKIVEDNLTDTGFSNDKFIREMGMSRAQVYRKLKDITNQSISEFIRSVRLKKAVNYLHNSELSVSEIAYKVGFKTPSQFSKYFSETFGKPPKQFINEYLNKK